MAAVGEATAGDLSDISFNRKPIAETTNVGVVYIVGNDYHTQKDSVLRSGVTADCQKMIQFFNFCEDNYYVEAKENVTAKRFLATCKCLANYEKYPPCCDRIIIYFAGHGGIRHIKLDVDYSDINKNEIEYEKEERERFEKQEKERLEKESKIDIEDILKVFRNQAIKKKMSIILLLDACCKADSVKCEENELVASPASAALQSSRGVCDDDYNGYWTEALCTTFGATNERCHIVDLLKKMQEKIKGLFPDENRLLPSFQQRLKREIYFKKRIRRVKNVLDEDTIWKFIEKFGILLNNLQHKFEKNVGKSQTKMVMVFRNFNIVERHRCRSSHSVPETLKSYEDLFDYIGKNYLYYDYCALNSFVEMSEDKEAIGLMKQYMEDIKQIVIHNLPERCQTVKHSDGNKLKIILQCPDVTARELEFLNKTLNKCFSLSEGYVIILREVKSGCVILVYEISSEVKGYLLGLKITTCQLKLLADLKMGITYIRIDDEMELRIPLDCSIEDVVSWTRINLVAETASTKSDSDDKTQTTWNIQPVDQSKQYPQTFDQPVKHTIKDPVAKIDSPPTFITTKSLDACFARLLLRVCDILNHSTTKEKSLKKCKEYCFSSKNPPLSEQKIYKITECINFNELLENIKEYMSWDECSMLHQIVGQCESLEAKEEVCEFEKKLAFYEGLEIRCYTTEFEISTTEFVQFSIAIDKPCKQLTMKDYIDIKTRIVKLLRLHSCVLKNFCKLLYNPLYMEWLVSVELINDITKMVHQKRDIIISEDVVLVQIGKYKIIEKNRPITEQEDFPDIEVGNKSLTAKYQLATQRTCSSATSHVEMKVAPKPSQVWPQTSQEVPQQSQGVPQPTQGVHQPTQEVTQSTHGVTQPSQGPSQPTQRVTHPSQGVPQPSQGVLQSSQGVPPPTSAVYSGNAAVVNEKVLKERPTRRMLSRITGCLAADWRIIGYELLKPGDVKCIDGTTVSNYDKCLDMLIKWLESDTSASYSKLIDALDEHDLHNAAEQIKNKVLK